MLDSHEKGRKDGWFEQEEQDFDVGQEKEIGVNGVGIVLGHRMFE